ncbi:MAG: PIN domain-containing protein [Betaproteobacteria bacterium]|nr:PIN domain-containing protein [Betaproteobacteria bacterium]
MGDVQRIFLDSNVLIYAFSATDPVKQERARALADDPGAVISTQVLSEFANIVLRKFGMPVSEARKRTSELAARCEVVVVTPSIVIEAFRIRERFGFGFFHSQIVATALAAGAITLYSEDLHHGQKIEGALRIVSPFAPSARQPRAPYRVRRPRRT